MSDIDTVELIRYNESNNRRQFIRDYCLAVYDSASPELTGIVGTIFRDMAGISSGSGSNRKSRKSIGVEALY
jgi:hypothetical protein